MSRDDRLGNIVLRRAEMEGILRELVGMTKFTLRSIWRSQSFNSQQGSTALLPEAIATPEPKRRETGLPSS